ncbi:MAG: ATP-binding cassette domain-containing protein, partial [Bacteroides sp.]|nr:ATP-binding cassette domain-containing protein [Bacteroides sp.]
QNLTYIHPDKEILFQNLTFSIASHARCAIIGENGVGKSTLLQIIAHKLKPASGTVAEEETPYFVPQHLGQYNERTVAEALDVSRELDALHAILRGEVTEENLACLNEKWDLEEQVTAALGKWDLSHVSPDTPMRELSGGEKTKVFLAGITLHRPGLVLLDEPTNHLDLAGREKVYAFLAAFPGTIVVVSHDRTLLNRMSAMYEMSADGIRFYPMNYNAYKEWKEAELQSKTAQLENRKKELKKAQKEAKEAMERQQKHNVRGEKQSEKKGIARIAMGNLQNRAENSTAKLSKVKQEKLQGMNEEIRTIRSSISLASTIKIDFHSSTLHAGRKMIEAKGMNFAYPGMPPLWRQGLEFTVYSGERIRLTGANGSGKSTLLELMVGLKNPTEGTIHRADNLNYVYLDQEYSLIRNDRTILEQVTAFNATALQEHEIKICLNRFLFTQAMWDKRCACLSGGERMRLALCCLMVGRNTPDIIIADEPTNNIDIVNVNILTSILKEYHGTLIVVSHDVVFLDELSVEKEISLTKPCVPSC